ncbi:hypothetical protein HPB50_001209 [Hyalomma asiaticum]|uniref:Uncharacterized protein n=1 Tax=Hyalomma asiaticum TaxID=266040 RepID=A0ACB7T946_HYAAI|nr:hypothetical protein HPB50_001209 [Hyalomma asiaticum]
MYRYGTAKAFRYLGVDARLSRRLSWSPEQPRYGVETVLPFPAPTSNACQHITAPRLTLGESTMVGCHKPGCLGEPVQNGRTSLAICPVCRLANCLNCNAIHEGISCKAYMKSIAADVSPAQTATNQGARHWFVRFADLISSMEFFSIRIVTRNEFYCDELEGRGRRFLLVSAAKADEDSAEILVSCKVTGCGGRGYVDKDDAMFRCVICNHFTCMKCSAFHESMTCAEYHKNKDNVQEPMHKPVELPQEGSGEPEPEEAEDDDDDAEGRIVECAQENCKGFSYVYKTATMAQCELCQHWTCVACKVCHESQTCAQYKGIDVPAEAELPEPLKTDDVGDEPAGAVGTVATTRAYENFPKVQKGAYAQSQAVSEVAAIRGYENCKKVQDPREKEKRYQELVAVYEQDVVSTTQEFECAICFVDVEPGKGIILKNCHHKVCEQCLADTAKNSPNAEVKCPCVEDDAPCQMSVFDSDLRACLSKEEYDALQDRSLREAENRSKEPSFHCKTPDCKGWCLHDQQVELFQCPVCNKENCLRCEAIHEGMTCAQYQDDLKRRAENDAAAKASLNFLEEMLRSQQAMRCPQCRIVIIKRVGCDFMVCTSCKTQLCWATKGARWGPNEGGP